MKESSFKVKMPNFYEWNLAFFEIMNKGPEPNPQFCISCNLPFKQDDKVCGMITRVEEREDRKILVVQLCHVNCPK